MLAEMGGVKRPSGELSGGRYPRGICPGENIPHAVYNVYMPFIIIKLIFPTLSELARHMRGVDTIVWSGQRCI